MGKQVCETEIEIKNETGLHMRPAMRFVDLANRFRSEITVSNGDTRVDAKSIMQISLLAATCGTKLKVRAEGLDAQEAVDSIREFAVERNFGESAPAVETKTTKEKGEC